MVLTEAIKVGLWLKGLMKALVPLNLWFRFTVTTKVLVIYLRTNTTQGQNT